VVVAPCLVLAIAWWAGTSRAVRGALAVAGVFGALAWGWLVAEVLDRRRTLVFDFESTANPLYRGWRVLLPDYRHPAIGDWVLQAAWFAALAVVAAAAVLALRRWPRPASMRRR
jgi:hypothetical protein